MNFWKLGKSLLTRGITGTIVVEGGKKAGQVAAEKYVGYKAKSLWTAGLVKMGFKKPEEPKEKVVDRVKNKVKSYAQYLEEVGETGEVKPFNTPVEPQNDPANNNVSNNNNSTSESVQEKATGLIKSFANSAKKSSAGQITAGILSGVKRGLKSNNNNSK